MAGLFDAIRTSLAAAFEPVRRIPHYGESGKAIEDILRGVLSNHFPARFGLRSGIVIGTDGTASNQSDLLIVDEPNCPAFLRTGQSGIFPSGGILGSIEVTTHLDKEKFAADTAKVRALKRLGRPSERLHWRDAPAGFLVAVDGPANLRTCAEWLSEAFEQACEESKDWELPGCVLIVRKDQTRPSGLVCFWDNNDGADRMSFNPQGAAGVTYFESDQDVLSVFLHCVMSELRRVGEERWKSAVSNFLLGGVQTPRSHEIELGPEMEALDLATAVYPRVVEAMGLGFGHFPELVSYFSDALFERVGAIAQRVS